MISEDVAASATEGASVVYEWERVSEGVNEKTDRSATDAL